MFVIMHFVSNPAAIKVGGNTISKDDLYKTMKDYYTAGLIVDEIDKIILPQKYKLTEKMEDEIKDQADYWLNMYEGYYGYTEEEFLEENHFKTKAEFIEYLRLDYRRELCYYDYLESKLEKGSVEKYYEENKETVDKAENEHILIATGEDMTDEQAEALANEIIEKLNDGASFADVAKEYVDTAIYQELGFVGKDDAIAEEYLDALFKLKDGEYTTEPVKTEFGYHIIHRTKTSEFDDVRKDIIDILAEDIITSGKNLAAKSLVELRKEYKLDIKDKALSEKYNEYVKNLDE